ncbi:MAG TPA: methyltransferase [Cellulomonas sp.]
MSPDPLTADRGLLAALRADLDAAGFTVAGVEELLGPVAAQALHREQAVPALLATGGLAGHPAADGPGGTGPGSRTAVPGPRAALVRAFVLGVPVPRRALAAALPTLGVPGAEAIGLLAAAGRDAGDPVRARVDLRPYAAADGAGTVDWWIASDLGELATRDALRPDHVLGVGGASTTLAQVTVRDRRGRTLDLGTGCGIQALHAVRHSGHVVATDISARALAFTRFNTALAGVDDRVETRAGSMLEPVRGEQFDLVVSNPPFVITPRRPVPGAAGPAVPLYEYRDAGRTGDAVVSELVTSIGGVLAPGGVAQLLGNWEVRRGERWDERVGAWLDASGLDGWVVQRELQDPAEYAETWIRDGGTTPDRDPETWAVRYRSWLDDFASRDVEAIGFGIVVLRRSVDVDAAAPGARLRRLEEVTGTVQQPLGPTIADSLVAHTWLAARDDTALAAERVRVAGDVTEERYLRPGDPDPQVVLLRQGGGLGRTVQAGTALAGLVGACDGELTLGQIAGALAVLLDAPVADVLADVLPAVRGLVRDTLLLPA